MKLHRGKLVLALITATAFSGAFSAYSASRSHDPVTVAGPKDAGGCQTVVDGNPVTLKPGESLAVGRTWRNCEIFEGHPLIVFSNQPPKHTTP